MKILLLSHKFNPDIGGIEMISEILATEFYKMGINIRVVTRSECSKDNTFAFKVIRNPQLTELISLHLWADVILENNPCVGLSWPALLLRKPTVVALHTWIARPDGKLTWLDKLKILKLKTAQSVIAVSEAIAKNTFKKATVIPNPFDAHLFRNFEGKRRNNDFVFLGRLVSDKGVDLAIEAIAILNSENKNYKLTIIGDGPELQKLIMQAADLGISEHVTFLGSLKGGALVEHLKQHQFMLIPSRWKEPFGVVALEAIACGCIPIVSDGGGLPDAVGNAGLVFQRGSLVDLVNKIRTLLKDSILRGKLIEAGPVHLASHHPDAIAKKYLSLLKGAINKYSNS